MFDGFEFNPTFEITAVEFTFQKLPPLLAGRLTEALMRNIDYAGFSDVKWELVAYGGKPTLRGEHGTVPIAVSRKSMPEFVDRIGTDTRLMVAAFNEVIGADVKFDSIGVCFANDEADAPDE